jgi:hypothetical protein
MLFAAIFTLWCAIWIWGSTRVMHQRSVLTIIDKWANILPPFVIISSSFVWLLTAPLNPPSVIVRAIHYCGIVVLFVFLIFGAHCQMEAWIRMRGNSPELLARTYRKWWIATRLLPAPAALCILCSGLRLVYESPFGNLSFGWMFWLIVSFSFFFFDGLLFYLPEICCRHKAVNEEFERGCTVEQIRFRKRFSNETMLLVHAISFPFVFAVGCTKPDVWEPHKLVLWLQNPFAASSPGTARLLSAVILILLIGLILFLIRLPNLLACIRFLRSSQTVPRQQTVPSEMRK